MTAGVVVTVVVALIVGAVLLGRVLAFLARTDPIDLDEKDRDRRSP